MRASKPANCQYPLESRPLEARTWWSDAWTPSGKRNLRTSELQPVHIKQPMFFGRQTFCRLKSNTRVVCFVAVASKIKSGMLLQVIFSLHFISPICTNKHLISSHFRVKLKSALKVNFAAALTSLMARLYSQPLRKHSAYEFVIRRGQVVRRRQSN